MSRSHDFPNSGYTKQSSSTVYTRQKPYTNLRLSCVQFETVEGQQIVVPVLRISAIESVVMPDDEPPRCIIQVDGVEIPYEINGSLEDVLDLLETVLTLDVSVL